MKFRHVPPRLAAGAYILNSGLSKRGGDEGTAQALHGMASNAYPVLEDVDPVLFLKALSAAEIAVGAALLLPVVPTKLAALALGAFSGGLLGMYVRTPALHGEGWDVRPTPDGIGVAKDVFLVGIAANLLLDEG